MAQEMQFETLTQTQAQVLGGRTEPTPVADGGAVPVRRKVSRKVKLEVGQILQAADGAIDIGLRASRRKCERGDERAYLGSLLRDLSGWAKRTEPDLELAQFIVDAQRVGRTIDLRRQLADRRTDAFRRALASARAVAAGDNLDEPDAGEHADMKDESNTGDAAGDAATADANGDGDNASSRVAPQLDEDIGLADIMPVPPTPATKTAVSKIAGAVKDILSSPLSGAEGGPRARVAQQLDEDIDLADIMPAPATLTSAAKNTSDTVSKLDNTVTPQTKTAMEEDEQYDYDMEILREFEMGE